MENLEEVITSVIGKEHKYISSQIAKAIRTHILSQLKEKEHAESCGLLTDKYKYGQCICEAGDYNQFRSELKEILGGEDGKT